MRKFYLLLIVLVASVLRLWNIGQVPISPDWDEAALGYNAYSVLKTGRDEYGTFLPAVLRSFDDYKPPLYMYLTLPSIAIFGLDTWSVRLPSAVMGLLAVIGTYFLAKEMLQALLPKSVTLYWYVPYVVALLLAISPWHVHFSRIAFEANIGITLNIWYVVFFFRGLRNWTWFIPMIIVLSLSLYAYHSERVFSPLLFILLLCLFWKKIYTLGYKKILLIFVIGLLMSIPLLRVFADPVNWTRLKGTSSLSDTTRLLERSVKKIIEDQKQGNVIGVLFDNRRIVYLQKLSEGYLDHFSARWLFLTGDNDRHHAPDMGLLYLVELPFIIFGMYKVATIGGKFAFLIFGWFFIVPIAASPTSETPHAIRTMVFLPTWQIFTAFGLFETMQFLKFKPNFFRNLFTIIILTAFAFNITYYLHMYHVHLNPEYSYNWQYGYKEAVEYVQKYGNQYDKIIISTKLEQPHIFFLYYLKYDPIKYLAQGGTASGGFAETKNSFDKYIFRPIIWSREVHKGSTLFIGTPKEIPENNTIYKVKYLNGVEGIRFGR